MKANARYEYHSVQIRPPPRGLGRSWNLEVLNFKGRSENSHFQGGGGGIFLRGRLSHMASMHSLKRKIWKIFAFHWVSKHFEFPIILNQKIYRHIFWLLWIKNLNPENLQNMWRSWNYWSNNSEKWIFMF